MILAMFALEISILIIQILKGGIFVNISFCVSISMCEILGIVFKLEKEHVSLCLSFFVQLHISILKQTVPWFLCLPLSFLLLFFPLLLLVFFSLSFLPSISCL